MIINEIYKERIDNPVKGETLYVLESNEQVFRIEFAIDPHSSIAAEHIHPSQQQTIHVIEGALGCRINGQTRFLGVGESTVIPAGSSHFQWNPTNLHARAIEEIRPAGKAHNFFRVLFTLAREGRTNGKGIPTPLIGAAFAAEFADFVIPRSFPLRMLLPC
jgi:quercetin dioxygenase-like cupin family protein